MCAAAPDPDRHIVKLTGSVVFTDEQFADAMNFSAYAAAYADNMGEVTETYTKDHWRAVQGQITFMAFRADVLARVADLKTNS